MSDYIAHDQPFDLPASQVLSHLVLDDWISASTVITGNTRMHDLGNVETYRAGKRVRGGTYWGIASEQVREIAAWIDFAEGPGFKRMVLVGHSAGANAVREYQVQTHDPRVERLILASGDVRPDTGVPPPEWVSTAKQDIADGRPEELVQGPFSKRRHILGYPQ